MTNVSAFPHILYLFIFSLYSSWNASIRLCVLSGASIDPLALSFLLSLHRIQREKRKDASNNNKKRGEKMFSLFVSSFLLFFSQLSWYIAVLCISEHDIYIFQTRSLSILFHQFHVVLLFRLKLVLFYHIYEYCSRDPRRSCIIVSNLKL